MKTHLAFFVGIVRHHPRQDASSKSLHGRALGLGLRATTGVSNLLRVDTATARGGGVLAAAN
jgi:hypothetical protein